MNTEYNNFSTKVIHAGQSKDPLYGATSTPIYQTSTYAFDTVDAVDDIYNKRRKGHTYTRGSNPTTAQLEQKIAAIEGGETCIVTSSGMGAISACLLTLLNKDEHVVTSRTLYGGTAILMGNLTRFGIEVTYVDTTNQTEIKNALRDNTKLIYIETPANPTIRLTDIPACAKIAHENNALLVVDSTFACPPIQYPLKLGADMSIHSLTKYMSGHGDSLGGSITGKEALLERMRTEGMKCICGNPPSPMNSWLILRGLKTLPFRIKAHCENGMEIARFLESHPYVEKVNYPGLKSHPQHGLALEQMNGFGGMISFELKDGIHGLDSYEACKQMLNQLSLCALGVSLGDVDTLIEHPASMTHFTYSTEERAQAGITDGLIRLSVGLEDCEDIIGDLEQGLNQIGL